MAEQTYSFAPARGGLDGCLDKLCQFEAMARVWSRPGDAEERIAARVADRAFREFVIAVACPDRNRTVRDQIAAWEGWVERRPYFREPGEVVGNPKTGAERGGDCDDMVVLALAGYYCLGVTEAKAQILADEDESAYHVRCLVPEPPIGRVVRSWRVFDPVWRSEEQWAHGKARVQARGIHLPAAAGMTGRTGGTAGASQPQDSSGPGLGTLLIGILLAAWAGYALKATR